MADQTTDPKKAGSPPEATPPAGALTSFQLPDVSEEVATTAEAAGMSEQVRDGLADDLRYQVARAGKDAGYQYRQAVLWRQWNIVLGLAVGALAAGAGIGALLNHNAGVIFGLAATFATGSLSTLNAGSRKAQSQAAGCAYQEVEDQARQLLNVDLPYISLSEAHQRTNQLKVQLLQINRVAEPPTKFAKILTPKSATRPNPHQPA